MMFSGKWKLMTCKAMMQHFGSLFLTHLQMSYMSGFSWSLEAYIAAIGATQALVLA